MPNIISSISPPDSYDGTPGGADDVPKGYDSDAWPKPSVTVDNAVLAKSGEYWHVLLIKRGGRPYKGYWALPGGFIDMDEDLHEAARRELEEETGLAIKPGNTKVFEQFRTYAKPRRDPRDRIITVVFLAILKSNPLKVTGADDATETAWVPLDSAIASGALAVDHAKILSDLRDYCREKGYFNDEQ